MASPPVVLYHLPPSFYSQIARLVLEEKGVAWRGRLASAGPPTYETYAPWYMRLNPEGTVPTLLHGDRPIPDSLSIARYVDAHFEGPALVPEGDAPRGRMEEWIARLRAIPVRELSYGGPRERRVGHAVNRRRLANLRRRLRRNPEMAEVYAAKIADIEGFAERSLDAEHVAGLRDRLAGELDELDRVLEARDFVAGERYTLADAHWTVGVARFEMLALAPREGRPALAAWYARMRERPSFARADVWERFRPLSILRALATRYRLPLLLLAAAVGAAAYLAT